MAGTHRLKDTMSGMRAELEIPATEACPVARFTERTDGSVTSVRRARNGDGEYTEEFTATGNVDPDAFDQDLESLFEYQSAQVFQFTHDLRDCVCEYVEQHEHPIADVRAQDGSLVLTLHLTNITDLRDLVTDLREQFGSVRIRYLLQVDSDEEGADDVVPINRARLTDRQLEVLETAHEMGYFSYPRSANATDVANALGIDASTFTEHLAAAQSKLMDEILATP
ncbi:helix-turn-helix domain-containing protein [Halapricum desulfuricans]|nr:helix-turn-helix domain-containing protein [Halapricum desulfuricans]